MDYIKLPIDKVELDLENPRIKQWLGIYGGPITSEAIALALSTSSGAASTSSYDVLKESIKVNRGIINPIMADKDAQAPLLKDSDVNFKYK